MAQQDPANTSVADICQAALKESGRLGLGQTALAEEINDAWTRLQWMLQQWERKRWLVYQLVTLSIVSTGAQSYTIGPGGDISTGTVGATVRPAKLESAFLRQLTQSQPNQIDYDLRILASMEDYNRIALKQLMSFPGYAFLDPGWPLARLYTWPVPQANIYGVYITILQQLPAKFPTVNTLLALPYEYYAAMVYNLAIRLRPRYGIMTFPGDPLPGMAKDALNVLRGANTAIAALNLPDLGRPGLYNIFSDRMY